MAFVHEDITRSSLITRLLAARPRVVTAIAPAGYGKSTVIRQYAQSLGLSTICDCAGVKDVGDLARAVAAALAAGDRERNATLTEQRLANTAGIAGWISLALDSWSTPSPHELFVFENAEQIVDSVESIEFLSRLLARTPASRRIAICSRRALPMSLSRFFVPHEIVALRSEDLRFDDSEIRSAFFGIDLQLGLIERIANVTRGWPIAIFLLARLAKERALSAVFDDVSNLELEQLYDYLSEQVLVTMPEAALARLIAIAAIPNATATEVAAALDDERAHEELPAFAQSSPFLYATGQETYEAHPLVKAMLLERYSKDCHQVLLKTAHAIAEVQPLRAAQLCMAAGNQEEAAALLEGAHDLFLQDIPPLFAEVVAQLDPEILLRHPAVWSAATLVRVGAIPHSQWLHEAIVARAHLTENTPIAVRAGVLTSLINVLSNLGRHEEARVFCDHLIQCYPDAPQCRALGLLFTCAIETRSGQFTKALELWRKEVEPIFWDVKFTRALAIEEIPTRYARYNGDREAERGHLETAVALAREARAPLGIALTLEEATFAAWFAGEDELYERYARELEAAIAPSTVAATEVFRASTRGNFEHLRRDEGAEHPKIRFYAALISCAYATGAHRAKLARLALSAADAAGEPMSAAIACVVCAEVRAGNRAQFLTRARAYASRVDSVHLRDAIEAYCNGAPQCGILSPLIRRLRFTLRSAVIPNQPEYHISLLRGVVEREGSVISLSPRELEIVLYIAARKRPCRREEIVETLWPECGLQDASSLRIYMNRIRNRAGTANLIVASQGSYRLGEGVTVDVHVIEADVSQARQQCPMQAELRSALDKHFEFLIKERGAVGDMWEWFIPVAVRLDDLTREVAMLLGRDALERGDCDAAIRYGQRIIQHDACDEPARELLIRAYLAADDRASALREFRVYRETLASELGARPSAAVQALLRQDEPSSNQRRASV